MSAAHDASDIDPVLAGRFLAGEMPQRERQAFQSWLAADPSRRTEMAIIRDLWVAAAETPDSQRVDAMWRSVQGQLHAATGGREPASSPPRLSFVTPRPAASQRRLASLRRVGAAHGRTVPLVTAAAMLLAALGLARLQKAPVGQADEVPPPREFRTGPGQRATIQLTDGTRVALGVASTLVVSPFGSGPRDVALIGEAMFDVVHDDAHPFRVHSSGTIVEDLGTRFAVRAYEQDRQVRVVVTSGVVSLHAPRTPAAEANLVLAGQLARFDSLGNVTVEAGVDTTRYLAWARGRVLIQNETLRDAAREMERWHDVSIAIPDARLAGLRITVDMRLGSLQKSLEAVTMPLGLRYQIVGQRVSIHR